MRPFPVPISNNVKFSILYKFSQFKDAMKTILVPFDIQWKNSSLAIKVLTLNLLSNQRVDLSFFILNTL